MNIILLSGGSGKRLWPLSNGARSKQFLPIVKNQAGKYSSMLQNVWRHLQELDLTSQTIIAANEHHIPFIHTQLGSNIPIVPEPSLRDTFAAIALSSVYIRQHRQADRDDVIIVLPVDSYADDSFYDCIRQLEQVVLTSEANIGLIGMKPDHPSDKYGYMMPDLSQPASSYLTIMEFVEKPNKETAEHYMQKGALWNSGIFAFKLGYLLDLLEQRGIPSDYEQLCEAYSALPNRSFDLEVIMNESKLAAIPFDGNWTDLGSWQEIAAHLPDKVNGYGFISKDSRQTFLINELQIPIVIMGVSDLIVAAGPDGILITHKNIGSEIRDVAEVFGIKQ